MTDVFSVELGRPEEQARFVKKYRRFFERLPNLQKALDAAFIKVNARLSNLDIAVLTLGRNCVDDFNEILLLCGNGFGAGGLTILRGMYEKLVVAYYLHLNPEVVDAFWDYHIVKLSKLKLDDVAQKIDPGGIILERFKASRTGEDKKRIQSSWSDPDFVSMANKVGLGEHLRNAYHLPLEYAHPSVTSILSALESHGHGVTVKDNEPQRELSEIAFTLAYFFTLEVLRLQVEHFNLDDKTLVLQQCVEDFAYALGRKRAGTAQLVDTSVKRAGKGRRVKSKKPAEIPIVDKSVEQSVGVSLEDLMSLYILESLKGFGPQKFKDLHLSKIRPAEVIERPELLPITGKRGELFRSGMGAISDKVREECRRRAAHQILTAHKYNATILTYDHRAYPRNVYESNNPIPVLYVRGSLDVLKEGRAVACVGSRKIRPPYSDLHAEFARSASILKFIVVSGFALGADRIGHEMAFRSGGGTICVMPGGLERPFPPENKDLWEELLNYHRAAFVTEFPFGVRAASLTLRKRNKLIVAFARGVLIGQSAGGGGAMNAYRFAREQHKPVATFVEDGMDDTSGNKLISQERADGDAVFPREVDARAYEQWLQELFSST
jgi:DNA protecting protein DprA